MPLPFLSCNKSFRMWTKYQSTLLSVSTTNYTTIFTPGKTIDNLIQRFINKIDQFRSRIFIIIIIRETHWLCTCYVSWLILTPKL